MNQKEFRRIVGFVARWFVSLGFDEVSDPRRAQGKRWQLRQILAAGLLGLMCGCEGLAEVERLTGKLSRAMRRQLGIGRRIPDTTMRAHWRVETTHQILDEKFEEDDHPWILNDPNGMLVLAVLRRIAYTLLTLYRSVTQRSEEKRQMPWKVLFELVRDTLIASTEATVASLRKRRAFRASPIAVYAS
jgi:hypothetical protein